MGGGGGAQLWWMLVPIFKIKALWWFRNHKIEAFWCKVRFYTKNWVFWWQNSKQNVLFFLFHKFGWVMIFCIFISLKFVQEEIYVITHSIRICRPYVVFACILYVIRGQICKIDHCIHIPWCSIFNFWSKF